MTDAPLIDVRPDHWAIVRDILHKHVPHYEVWAFGSRAKWAAKEYSDLDLCIKTDKPLDFKTQALLQEDFSDSDLPWKVDVVDWATTSESFRGIIERDKVVVQEREGRAREWPSVPLSELTMTPATYGVVQPGTHLPDGLPMLRVNNFNGHSLNLSDVMRIAPETEEKYERSRIQPGDVLITIVGSVGQVAIVSDEQSGWNIARAIAMIRPKEPELSRWIAFVLRSPQAQHQLGVAANTTVQTTINLKDLRQLQIPFPDKCTRKEICEILGSLDDRIDNLRQTNATLEAIAAALFKSWFVDFDGIAPEDMQESELGMIPKGWRVGTLGDVCFVHDSKRIPLSGAERAKRQGAFPYYGAAGAMDSIDGYLFDGTYVLVGEDGSVQTKDGYALTQYVWGKFWVNNHAHVLEGKNGYSTEQLLLTLQRVQIESYITGAVQPKLSQGNMMKIPVVLPTQEIVAAFAELIQPMFDSIKRNTEQTATLTTLRDSLLPRLISGQLRLESAKEAFA